MSQELEHVQCLIIGSGPAGYTAAIYAARADLKPVLYTGMLAGGQLTQTTDVENFPGYPNGIMGPEMMEDFRKQAERFGTDIRFGYISSVDFSSLPHKVVVDETKTILADTVIISTGASAKWLGLESEQKYNGFGVSACAVCDGFFFRGHDVAIVGAGDTAAEEATYLAKLCRKVYMLVRRDEFRASKAMVTRVQNTPNIEIIYNTEAQEIVGDGQNVTGVRVLNNKTQEESTLDVTGFFVAIGHHPNTDIFKGWIDMDETGYILTKPGTTQTNVEGVFCCGDAQDNVYRQAITAAGTGCMAALDAERYLAAKEAAELEVQH
ncbi:thioredoxin-disulfide reductase [Mucilaginibacter sp. Bleaf8]|uniref:thioredoxin-disulfide reductase n=1 Tax=Mucilaginibacter sp. Bleaf8 TaxID=2834430 RepID=UPI001BCE861F|nr:thioredoxin-disulfide reductase [Mucilaginibacter sp. Bleaf8]MBS7563772.1 thioredoxin-disulfide reductase [Mucilaginibacter sp. Bleaf8]